MKPNPKRILELLEEVADPKYEWEYADGKPMFHDAKAFLNELKRIKMVLNSLPADYELKI